jgi:hypothetical protein
MSIQNITAMESRLYGRKQNKIFVKKIIRAQIGVWEG